MQFPILHTSCISHKVMFPLQVIRRQDKERSDWGLFVKPFSKYLWTTLVLHSLVIVVILKLFWWRFNRLMSQQTKMTKMERGMETVKYYLMISSAYMGRSYNGMQHDTRTSIKVRYECIFCCLTLLLDVHFELCDETFRFNRSSCLPPQSWA